MPTPDAAQPLLPFFSALKGENTLTYRFLMEGGRPIKLGDGTFGSVFAVEDADRSRYAVKVFYYTDDQDARLSFRKEMNATQDINAALQHAGRETVLANLVLPVARTESFLSSAAAKSLDKYFREVNLSISDYAFVMERYECTLKDLLEKGNAGSAASGYDRLRNMSLARREKFVLWIAKEIATALRALHLARLHHHDLKPANILLRERGTRLEAGLADLGFLEPNRVFGTQNLGSSNLLPIGTRHYRSPEHKDYFDVCEVLIRESTSSKDVLETLDPKFKDTLIEKNDMLMYCKDPRKVLRRILDVHREANGKTTITVERANQPLLTQEKTQVVMYKRHTARTDGFGLGAIMYDILTCGYSPERFYDYFRRWDSPNKDVRSLIRLYKQFHTWQSAAVDVVSGFELLRAERSIDKAYPSPEVVGVLFRLLLPRAKGSYFSNNGANGAGISFEHVLEDLTRLVADQQAAGEDSVQNIIWRGESSPSAHSTPDVESFQSRLGAIQEQSDSRARLESGYLLFERLIGSIVDHLDESNCELPYVADMSPQNVRVQSSSPTSFNIRPRYAIFDKLDDYKRALQDGDLHNIESALRGQLPISYQFRSRDALAATTVPVKKARSPGPEPEAIPQTIAEDEYEVDIDIVHSTEVITRETYTLDISIFYTDGCPFWIDLECGDHVILGLELPRRVVAEVIQVYDKASVRVAYEWPKAAPPLVWGGEPRRVRVAKRFRKMDYYFAVIGSYIQQIFFVDNKRFFGELPQEVYLVEQAVAAGRMDPGGNSDKLDSRLRVPIFPIGLLPLLTRLRRAFSEPRGVDSNAEDCYRYLAEIYLWLGCRFFRRGNRSTLSDIEHVREIRRHVNRLGDAIAVACGRPDRTHILINNRSARDGMPPNAMTFDPDLEELLRRVTKSIASNPAPTSPLLRKALGRPPPQRLTERSTK